MLCGLCRFSANTNNKVKVAIVKDIRSQPGCEFDERLVCRTQKIFSFFIPSIYQNQFLVAARRCYENLRRISLEQREDKIEYAEEQAKRRKYRSRKERVCTYLIVIFLFRYFC